MEFHKGQRIRYVMDNLGCVRSDHIVMSGDIGIYQGPAPVTGAGDAEGWHLTVVTTSVSGGTALHMCPVHESMFEPADQG